METVDSPEEAEFAFVCLDRNPVRHVHLLRNVISRREVDVDVPPVLDASGATIYWTTAAYETIVKHKPRNVRKAFIKCGKPPKLETVLVQLMKRSLDLPLRASVTVGRHPFKHIDFEIQSQKKLLLHNLKRSALSTRLLVRGPRAPKQHETLTLNDAEGEDSANDLTSTSTL